MYYGVQEHATHAVDKVIYDSNWLPFETFDCVGKNTWMFLRQNSVDNNECCFLITTLRSSISYFYYIYRSFSNFLIGKKMAIVFNYKY